MLGPWKLKDELNWIPFQQDLTSKCSSPLHCKDLSVVDVILPLTVSMAQLLIVELSRSLHSPLVEVKMQSARTYGNIYRSSPSDPLPLTEQSPD